MKFDYAYHITVDEKVLFIGSKLRIKMLGTAESKTAVLEKIGPKGIYVTYPNLKNIQFLNFNNIESIQEV